MTGVFEPGDGRDVLVVVDHASNAVPEGIALGVDPALLATHIAWDIGAAALARQLGLPRFLATVSRLVVDLNREADSAGLVPRQSDGVDIPGNADEVSERVRFWHAYHDALAGVIDRSRPALIVSLHSFTPRLATDPTPRPWEVGVLYNRDDRAARLAIPLLEARGVVTGDNLPYSGQVLNATMNRHAEQRGLPYLGLEVRQDLIDHDEGVARWAAVLAPVITEVRGRL